MLGYTGGLSFMPFCGWNSS